MLLSASLLLTASLCRAETPAMLELRRAAALSESSVRAATNEDAAAANGTWAENSVPARPTVYAAPIHEAPAPVMATPARPALVAPPADEPDPLPPPNPKGWTGFKLGFLGTESKALSLLSGTGKAALPLFLLLQPLILPAALFVGLLGIFGVRL